METQSREDGQMVRTSLSCIVVIIQVQLKESNYGSIFIVGAGTNHREGRDEQCGRLGPKSCCRDEVAVVKAQEQSKAVTGQIEMVEKRCC